jgi:hypothetical protein
MAPREADAASVAATFEGLVGPRVDEMYRAAAAMVGEADARDVRVDLAFGPAGDAVTGARARGPVLRAWRCR